MADAISDFLLETAIWMGAVLILFSPVLILFFFRNKISWLPGRLAIDIWVYRLKSGKHMDEKGRVKEEDIELIWKNLGWRVSEFKIPWLYVQYNSRGLKGFKMDAAGFALIRRYDKPVIRILECSPEIREASNFVFIDVPDPLDPIQIQQSISVEGEDMRDTLRTELTRPQVDDLWKAVVLPLAAMGIAVLIIILTLNWSQQQYGATIGAGVADIGQTCTGWATINGYTPPVKNTTGQPAVSNSPLAPFTTTR